MQLDLAVSKLPPVHTDKYNIHTEVAVIYKGFVCLSLVFFLI